MGVHILISNDDGIYSPGLAALAEVASRFGTVRIVAPDVERSSTGHAITANRPLSYRQTKIGDFAAYRVDGTPADCVALGAHLWGHVDVVLSGMNLGLNLGSSVWHSGTLAAAKQAALLGLRGIALSAPSGLEPHYDGIKPFVARVLESLLPETSLRLVNVNVPREPRGIIWTRVSIRQYDGHIVPTTDPMGRPLYWFTVRPLEGADEGTDRWALEQGWVSMTPLGLDLTHEALLGKMKQTMPLDEARAHAVSPPRSSPAEVKKVREDEAKPTLEASDAAPAPAHAAR